MSDPPIPDELVDRTAFDCVAEQPFRLDAGDFLERGAEIWHVARTRGRDADFAPIRCSEDEGIVFHGGIFRREPTCPNCRRIVGLDDRTPLPPGPHGRITKETSDDE